MHLQGTHCHQEQSKELHVSLRVESMDCYFTLKGADKRDETHSRIFQTLAPEASRKPPRASELLTSARNI